MSTLFLFGAGASYGSLDCRPYPPPRGCELFNELQSAGGTARTVRGELADLFRQNFEEGMDAFFSERNEDVSAFLRDMAEYFAQFEPGVNSLYKRLISAVQRSKGQAVFSTTNYDLLIEIAANQAGFAISYHDLPVPKDNLPVIKIHGSCNFLPDVSGQIQNVKFEVSRTGGILSAGVRIALPEQVIEFCHREDSIAPAIAMYAGSKWVPYCRRFVEDQQKYWQQAVSQAKRIFVIGAGIHEQDTHIWEPLAKSAAWLGYVGKDWSDFHRWDDNNRKHAHFVARTFKDAIPAITRCLDRP